MKFTLVAVVLLQLLMAPSPVGAATSHVPLRDHVLTTWTHADGVPLGQINFIRQTSDGYLWLVTRDAFLRFDGMRFVRPTTPCTVRVDRLAAAADGGLWATCGSMLIRRTVAGKFVVAPFVVPRESFWMLADRGGRLWILGDTIRYLNADGTAGRTFASPLTPGGLHAAEDSEGTIWATDQERLFHLYPDRVEAVGDFGFYCATASRSGGVFAATRQGLWRLRKGVAPVAVSDIAIPLFRQCMTEATDGSLWMSSRQSGLARLQGSTIERLADGAFDRQILDILVDRDDTIWLASPGALHRFRKPAVRFTRLSSDQGQPQFVFIDSRDQLWTGSTRNLRWRDLTGGREHSVAPDQFYAAIGEDERRTIWLANGRDIGYVTDGKFMPVLDATGRSIGSVYAFARDPSGSLWAVAKGVGVYRVTPGAPRLVYPSQRAAVRFLVSERSGVWIGLVAGGLEQHYNGGSALFPRPNPALVDPSPRMLLEDGESVWVASFAGLERLRKGTWTLWTRQHGLPGDGTVKAIVSDRLGYFWMMTGGGLVRVSRAELDATPDGHPRPLSLSLIGALDGVVPHPGTPAPSPTVAADREGRLLFTTQDGVVTADPVATSASPMTPPIVLESVSVDNAPVDHTVMNRFVEPSRLQFEYTSLHIHDADVARFRYRLEGYERDWVEAGGARRVTYGTLRPGAYVFRVIGAGGQGVWNGAGASYAFQIAPVFWRTNWFRAAALLLGLAILLGVYHLRIRQLTRQFNVGLDARVGERTRIARELHDTLLQSFQGVVIHFQAATNLLPGRPEVAKQKLEGALERATQAIIEGRDAVQAMRESAATSSDLPKALSALAAQLIADHGGARVEIQVHVEGVPRDLHPIVRDDVYRIASEALRNAARHAQARLIQIDVHYDDRELRLKVRDDGRGFDSAMLEGRGMSGHWGLPGMRERAALIGGTLEARSRPGAGTEIELSLPESKAYAGSDGPVLRRFWPRTRTGARS